MGRSDETFRSPDLQLEAARRVLPSLGAVEHRVYEDIDRTGTDFHRDGIQAAIADARAGEIDLLIAYDLARFGRNVTESLTQIRVLRDAGVRLASTTEPFDDSPEGQFMLTQFLAFAELYSKQLGRRWSQLKAYRFERGLYTGSTPPLGYLRAPVEGVKTASGRQKVSGPLLPDPDIGPAVARAFAEYAAGLPIAEVVRRFSAARRTPTAKTVVKDMLRNPVYVGRLRTAAGEAPGMHEPLVDEVTWQRVQRRLERDARTPSRLLAVSHSLVGLAFCAHCHYGLVRHVDRARGLERLHCREDTPRGCRGVGQPQVWQVEEAVLAEVHRYVGDLRVDRDAAAVLTVRRSKARADLTRLRGEVSAAERALAALAEKLARGVVSDRAYKLTVPGLEADLSMLLDRMAELEAVTVAPLKRERVRAIDKLLTLWPDATPAERNRMLRDVVRRVEVRKATRWREPVEDRTSVDFL